jgi:hypothetical protein
MLPGMVDRSVGEARDRTVVRFDVPAAVWREKILRDHPELASHLADVLRAIAEPDCVLPDPVYEGRRRHYLRGAGPSRWLLGVVRHEQEPAWVISAFGKPEGSEVMEQVNIRIGHITFDHADYGAGNDVLYLDVGDRGRAKRLPRATFCATRRVASRSWV